MTALAADGLPPLRDVIARHRLSARKALGQNFLLDLNLTSRIARASGSLDGAEVLEVGPGPGGLTRALLAGGAARVIAVERDPRCLDALREVAAHHPGRLTVIEGDALDIDVASLLSGHGRIVANLPYNVGTALLARWLGDVRWPPAWRSLTLLFQQEVAERIVADPGGKTYGRLSVLSQWRSTAQRLFDIPPQAFTPPPKVTSTLVRIVPTAAPDVTPARLEAVTAAAFSQRRKMLRRSLRSPAGDVSAWLAAAGIDPTRRAETISVDEFVRLAQLAPPSAWGSEALSA